MPKFIRGDMFAIISPQNVYICTTNSSISPTGELVMGKGAALCMKMKFPGITIKFGKYIIDTNRQQPSSKKDKCRHDVQPYHLYLTKYNDTGIIVGMFQTKMCWWQDANIEIIRGATEALWDIASKTKSHVFNLNYPGIGCGNLKRSDVEDIINNLPDNVLIWEL